MRYTLQQVEDILFDGTRGQMDALADADNPAPLSYAITGTDMTIRVGEDVASYHGLSEAPACAEVFGPSRVFK